MLKNKRKWRALRFVQTTFRSQRPMDCTRLNNVHRPEVTFKDHPLPFLRYKKRNRDAVDDFTEDFTLRAVQSLSLQRQHVKSWLAAEMLTILNAVCLWRLSTWCIFWRQTWTAPKMEANVHSDELARILINTRILPSLFLFFFSTITPPPSLPLPCPT